MLRAPGQVSGFNLSGFNRYATGVASPRLTNAVVASLAVSAVALCVIVTLTVLSIKVAMALPVPV